VHRYFFERESTFFSTRVETPTSPGFKLAGSDDSTAIILDNLSAAEFAKFLWVFYNKYVHFPFCFIFSELTSNLAERTPSTMLQLRTGRSSSPFQTTGPSQVSRPWQFGNWRRRPCPTSSASNYTPRTTLTATTSSHATPPSASVKSH